MTTIPNTSTTYQRTVRRAYADIVARRIRRMSYAELQAALDALWTAVITTKAEPVKPVEYEECPF
jgi:hypothetical protein